MHKNNILHFSLFFSRFALKIYDFLPIKWRPIAWLTNLFITRRPIARLTNLFITWRPIAWLMNLFITRRPIAWLTNLFITWRPIAWLMDLFITWRLIAWLTKFYNNLIQNYSEFFFDFYYRFKILGKAVLISTRKIIK